MNNDKEKQRIERGHQPSSKVIINEGHQPKVTVKPRGSPPNQGSGGKKKD